MENDIFITVEDSNRHYDDFMNFMKSTTDALLADSKNRRDYFLKRNGEKLEEDVLLCMRSKAKDFRFDPELIQHTLPQHFPDIISNNYFGVEVKTTRNNSWLSTGSSIVESLRDEEIKKVFMFFGILSKENIDFRCKPYEQCLSDIHVTHSPRYSINMDIQNEGETIFDKMGIDYDAFRKMGNAQIDKVREYYRKKCKSRNYKTMPWWIGDSNDIPVVSDLRLMSDLDADTKDFYISMCYALFPEILGKSQDKFRKPALWLCSRHSVLCTNVRDLFSAGGTGNIYIDDELRWSNVPKVICNLLPYLRRIRQMYFEKENIQSDIFGYASYIEEDIVDFDIWLGAANEAIKETLDNDALQLTVDELLNFTFEYKIDKFNRKCYYLKTESNLS